MRLRAVSLSSNQTKTCYCETFLHPLLPGLTVPFTEKWIKWKFGLDTYLKRCSLNYATHRDMIMSSNNVFWGYVSKKWENMLDTGPKRRIISNCAYKTSCTESRNLPEVNWCKVGRKKMVIYYLNEQNYLKSGRNEQILPKMHIPGLGGTLRAHFGSLKPGLMCLGLKMGLETCPTFSILLR